MFLVVVLFFSVACSAFPASEDGEQCLVGCYSDAIFPASLAFCERLSSFMTCWKSCPSSRLDAVVKQVTGLYQKQCSPSVSEEEREKFLHSLEDLKKRLSERASPCADRRFEDDEALCKNLASCLLGSALDELKDDYPTDVVAAFADRAKVIWAWFLKNPKSPPEACSILYEPYKA